MWQAQRGLPVIEPVKIEPVKIETSSFKKLVAQKIQEGKEFLYRMENQEKHGFYKKYWATTDYLEDRLHTVYSASIIYTFLYIYDWQKDEEILKRLPDWGSFLLFMQNKDENDPRYGAFHYSYYLDSQEKEKKFVVGTTALSIFTLLRMYDFTDNQKYLESAKLAGNWLADMQNPDGSMKPYVRYNGEKWVKGTKESLLYNGQVLSALSKIYKVTRDKKYYSVAEKIAERFVQKYQKEQGYIKGDYRDKNPISNAWVVMSLMDFYKVDPRPIYRDIIFDLSRLILEHQKDNGQIEGAYSTSGNGWILEVMAQVYRFCRDQDREDCEKYKQGARKIIGWIVERTYSEKNSSDLKNPARARGGVFWNKSIKYVRTDSVCHALNGYILIFDYLK